MGWKSLLLAVMAVLTGGGALPPPDCGIPTPLGHSPAASLDVVDPVTPNGSFGLPGGASVGTQVGCQGPVMPAINPLTSLRNEDRDVLHGLQPASQLRSPVDAARQGMP